jgi:DNA invertase Pin-like site-specific DNA recombinase
MNFDEFDRPFMVYGYCRISREEKLKNEDSSEERNKTIDEQIKVIEGYVKSKNWNEVRIYSEETTIPRLRRHLARENNQFSSMFSECKENDVIIISSADRVFGEVREAKNIISKLRSLNIKLIIADIDEDITKNDSYKILTALLDAFIKRQTISAIRRRSFDNQMGGDLSFRGGFNPIGFKSELKEGKKVFIVNEEEKAILEEILKFKKLREEDEGMRDNQKEKFGSADPKKYTTRQIEEHLIEKFKIDKIITRRISVNGREGVIKRFSPLTIHRLLTKEGYVEQKLSMIKRLEDLNKKDKK